jgi:hypothetical protein
MKKLKAQLTPSGSAGSASGTAAFQQLADGKLYAIYLDYAGSAPATTDVTIKLADPAVSLLTVSNNSTDGWYFPRQRRVSNTAARYTVAVDDAGESLPVVGSLNLVVAGCNAIADAVTAYVYVEEE